jgi:hypothetical protein
MASAYRKEIGRRTRRGLEGLARLRKPTGGRAYGYIAATETASSQREINPEHAPFVRWIFEQYAGGWSARRIAEDLNSRKVPSPGASWNREERRRGGWMCSAIAGDPKRGIGILNNDIYRGIVVWNRARWLRSAADSGKRKQVTYSGTGGPDWQFGQCNCRRRPKVLRCPDRPARGGRIGIGRFP